MFQNKVKIIFFLGFLFFSELVLSQEAEEVLVYKNVDSVRNDTLIDRIQVFEPVNVSRHFNLLYQSNLPKVRKVYPLALRAAELIDSLDMVMEEVGKKRLQKKAARQTSNQLKDEFKFLIKDMYVSEGQLLTKLIYRETGMTVREIIKKYKNGFEATFYSSMGKIFDQNLDEVYDPENRDYVIEIIVQEIINEQIEFDPTITTIDKEEFKEIKKEDRQRRRDIRKEKRKKRKQSS